MDVFPKRSSALGGKSHRLKSLLIAIAVWQLVCLAIILLYNRAVFQFYPIIRSSVLIAYNTWFYQVGYGTFVRIATYIEFDVITLPATLVSLRLFDALLHRRALFKPMAVTFLAWQFVVIAVLVLSYEVGFSYMINQLGWDLFGPPDSLYSFTNLVLPRMIAWLVCTTPVGWMALWWYSKG